MVKRNTTLAWIGTKLCDRKRYFHVSSFNKANNNTCQYNNVLVLLQLPGTHDDDDQVGTIDAVLGPVRAIVLLRVSTYHKLQVVKKDRDARQSVHDALAAAQPKIGTSQNSEPG